MLQTTLYTFLFFYSSLFLKKLQLPSHLRARDWEWGHSMKQTENLCQCQRKILFYGSKQNEKFWK